MGERYRPGPVSQVPKIIVDSLINYMGQVGQTPPQQILNEAHAKMEALATEIEDAFLPTLLNKN